MNSFFEQYADFIPKGYFLGRNDEIVEMGC